MILWCESLRDESLVMNRSVMNHLWWITCDESLRDESLVMNCLW